MTLYLWHIPAIAVATFSLHALGLDAYDVHAPGFWGLLALRAVVFAVVMAVAFRLLSPLEHRRLPWWDAPVRRRRRPVDGRGRAGVPRGHRAGAAGQERVDRRRRLAHPRRVPGRDHGRTPQRGSASGLAGPLHRVMDLHPVALPQRRNRQRWRHHRHLAGHRRDRHRIDVARRCPPVGRAAPDQPEITVALSAARGRRTPRRAVGRPKRCCVAPAARRPAGRRDPSHR